MRRNKAGYGMVKRAAFRDWPSHRVAWTLSHGPIPDGLRVLHHCDNPPCCEPSHLFIGTTADNHADMMAKGRHPQIGDNHWARRNPARWQAILNLGTPFPVKVTPAEVATIRARYAAGGISQEALGREYGISQSAVSMLVRRKRQAH